MSTKYVTRNADRRSDKEAIVDSLLRSRLIAPEPVSNIPTALQIYLLVRNANDVKKMTACFVLCVIIPPDEPAH